MNPDDLAAVAADDQLVDDLAAGCQPPDDDQVAQHLAAWRDETRKP